MIRLLFMIPLVLCLLWTIFLQLNGYQLRDGVQGYKYILILSAIIAAFYTLMWWLTNL